jgi:hypothetical protein
VSWLVALGFLKRIGLSVFAWLKSLSFWQLVSLALAAFALLQHFQLADARHDRDGFQRQLVKCSDRQKVLEQESKQKQSQVQQKITQYRTVTVPKIERQVELVERAPLLGNCATPKEVLQADI